MSAHATAFQPPASQLAWQPVPPTPRAQQAALAQQVRDLTFLLPVAHQYLLAVHLAVARSAVRVEAAPAHADEPRGTAHYRWQARGHSYHLTLRRPEALLTMDDHPLVGVFPTDSSRALAALRRHLPPPAVRAGAAQSLDRDAK